MTGLVIISALHLPRGVASLLMTLALTFPLLFWLYWCQLSLHGRIRRHTIALGLTQKSGRNLAMSCRRRRRLGSHHVRLVWKLPEGVTLRDVLNQQEAIEHACNGEVICSMDNGRLVMDVMRRPVPKLVTFHEFYRQSRPPGQMMIGLGCSRRGYIHADLAELPHLLIGGMTGGGKSVFLNQVLTHLVAANDPNRLRISCIDLKGGVELAPYGKLPHALHGVIDSIEGAAGALSDVRQEIDRRLVELRIAGLRDIEAWNAGRDPKWPRIVVVVDEVAELTVREVGKDQAVQAAQKAATGRLSEIARLGRAAGVHLIVCTQRPDAEAVPGQLKANLAATVAFRVRSAINSAILLESDKAALLPHIPGRAIWAHERLEEFQSIYLSRGESDAILDSIGKPQSGEVAERVTPRPQTASGNWAHPVFVRIFRPRKRSAKRTRVENAFPGVER